MKWFRFYHETLDDPKVQLLSDRRFRQWVNLLCVANQSANRGVLPNVEAVAFRLRETLDETLQMFADFEAAGLLDRLDDGTYQPHNWDRRQFKSDNVTERVEKHRKANEKQDSNVSSNQIETLQETFSDTDTELVSPNGLTRIDKPRGRKPRAPDPIFDTFCEVLELDPKRLNKTERGRVNAACKDVRDVDGTPDDIRLAAERYRVKWPDIDMTAQGITGNWQNLLNGAGEPRREPVQDIYGDLEENIRNWA